MNVNMNVDVYNRVGLLFSRKSGYPTSNLQWYLRKFGQETMGHKSRWFYPQDMAKEES